LGANFTRDERADFAPFFMEATLFTDRMRWARGFMPSVPLVHEESVGDAAVAGQGVLFSRYGEPVSWKGISPASIPAGVLLHRIENDIFAASQSGNVYQQHGDAIYFIGSGDVYYGKTWKRIGTANSLLQIYLKSLNKTVQAGLPAPSAPLLSIGVDSLGAVIAGQITGRIAAGITRVRTITGAESPVSPTSNVVDIRGGVARLELPGAMTAEAQDEWGIYFTEHGAGGLSALRLLRFVSEAEINGFTTSYMAGGLGSGSSYVGTTSAATSGRLAAIVLSPVGVTPPAFRGSSLTATPGQATTIRAQRPQATVDGDYLLVQITFDAQHRITPGANNRGTARLASVTGVWMDGPLPLNPNGERVQVRQTSQTEFEWKLQSWSGWAGPLTLATTRTALGVTGLAVAWSAASTGVEEVGNEYVIEPFALVAPSGWGLAEWQNNIENTVGMGVYAKFAASGENLFEWSTNTAAQMVALTVGVRDVNATTPITQTNSTATTAATSHTVSLPTAAGATELVVLAFAASTTAVFTPTAPIAPFVSTGAGASRFVDFDYANDDLTDIPPPRNVEGPPAATHGFGMGPVNVIAGALGGTALVASRPGQPEQYDLSGAIFLNPPEPIVRLEADQTDGSNYIFTRNSVQQASYTGDDLTPLAVRTLLSNNGLAHPSGACVARTGVFMAATRGGLLRVTGYEQASTQYADEVSSYVKDWNAAEIVIGEDRELDAVAHCFRRDVLLFFQSTGIWSTPLDVTPYLPDARMRILSAVTLDGRLHLSIGTGAADAKLYAFNQGAGGAWSLRSITRSGGAPEMTKTLTDLRFTANLDTRQQMSYAQFTDAKEEQCELYAPSMNLGGWCVGDLWVTAATMVAGGFFWEWPLLMTGVEIFGALSDESAMRGWGDAPPLPGLALAGARFGWRLTSSGFLEFWKDGAYDDAIADPQAGDVVRLRVDAGGVVVGELRRGATVVFTRSLGFDGSSWVEALGIKVGLVTPGARLGLGHFERTNESAQLRIYTNFDGENARPPRWSKSYASSGRTVHPWAFLNLINTVNYAVEAAGTGAGQTPSLVQLQGRVVESHQSLAAVA
jgi:hypothetical protein